MSNDWHPLQASVMEQLQAIRGELEALPDLPPANSPEALSIHKEWMAQCDKCTELRHVAEQIALWVIPSDVAKLLGEVKSLTWGKKSAWKGSEPETSEQVEA